MTGGWRNGIIAASLGINGGVLYFVYTPYGIAAMHPRVHEKEPRLGLGSYVRVIMVPSRSQKKNDSGKEEVECFEWNKQPEDHEVDVRRNHVAIKCNANFVSQEDGWHIFENAYLGRLGIRDTGGLIERNMKVGTLYRSICRVSKESSGISSIRGPFFWVMEDIDYAERVVHTGRWFDGVIIRSSDDHILITSPLLPEDVFLYDWQRGNQIKPDSVLGRWVRFMVDTRRANDGLRP